MNNIDFDKGLAPMERICLLANTPLLHLAASALPAYGVTTKRSATNTAGLLLVGAATVVCGSDRAADCT